MDIAAPILKCRAGVHTGRMQGELCFDLSKLKLSVQGRLPIQSHLVQRWETIGYIPEVDKVIRSCAGGKIGQRVIAWIRHLPSTQPANPRRDGEDKSWKKTAHEVVLQVPNTNHLLDNNYVLEATHPLRRCRKWPPRQCCAGQTG